MASLQHAHVVAMAAGDDDDVAGFVHRQVGEDFLVLRGMDVGGFGEALAIGETLAIIDHHGGEAGQRGHLREAFRDVPGPEDEGVRNGQHRLDEDIELAAADEAVIVGRVLAQVEGEVLGLFRLHDLPGGVPHLGFDAAAADGAGHGPVLAHQELGGLIAGDGPAHLDDGRERALLPQVAEPHQFLVNVHSLTIIAWEGRGSRREPRRLEVRLQQPDGAAGIIAAQLLVFGLAQIASPDYARGIDIGGVVNPLVLKNVLRLVADEHQQLAWHLASCRLT